MLYRATLCDARARRLKKVSLLEVLEVPFDIRSVGRLRSGMLQNVEGRMSERITRQHLQRSPSPDQTSLRESRRAARLKPHLNHLIAEPVCRMYGVACVREQNKVLHALAIADRLTAVHHIAKCAY